MGFFCCLGAIVMVMGWTVLLSVLLALHRYSVTGLISVRRQPVRLALYLPPIGVKHRGRPAGSQSRARECTCREQRTSLVYCPWIPHVIFFRPTYIAHTTTQGYCTGYYTY
ncbi:hypothetical protein B0H13DRAFT_565556 [Mycena leptocephala]|nr:hypothetical protein B0H13DRAFT_565556 [Mycena leptocephala]